jgi:hypothetical protein
MSDTETTPTADASPTWHRLAVYDFAEVESTEEAVTDIRRKTASLLKSQLHRRRLEVMMTSDGTQTVDIFYRSLDGTAAPIQTLEGHLEGVYIDPVEDHPLQRIFGDVTDVAAARRVTAQTERRYHRHLSFQETHQTHERPLTEISSAADISKQLIDQLGAADHPCVLQFVLQPRTRSHLNQSRNRLADSIDTAEQKLADGTDHSAPITRHYRTLKRQGPSLNTAASLWSVSIRGLAGATEIGAGRPAQTLKTVMEPFEACGSGAYQLTTTERDPQTAYQHTLQCRLCQRPSLRCWLRNRVPFRTPQSPHLLLSHGEVASFINPAGGIDATQISDYRETVTIAERYRRKHTADTLAPLFGDGATIAAVDGRRSPTDETVPLSLPPALRRRHTLAVAKSGDGKSLLAEEMALSMHNDEAHPVVFIDPKGDVADELTRMQYADTGLLDDIEVIDFSTETPRLPLVDLRAFPTAPGEGGPSRSTLIDTVVEDAIDAIRMLNGTDGEADQTAEQSYKLVELLMKLYLDNGAETVATNALLGDIIAYQRDESIGTASRQRFNSYLKSIESHDIRTKQKIGSGALRRLEPLFIDSTLAIPIGAPPETAAGCFDLPAKLTDDTLYVFDFGALGDEATALISHLLVARIWRLADTGTIEADATDETGILADVIIDEAHKLTAESLLSDILSQGRSAGVALTLLSQSLSNFTDDFRDQTFEEIGTVIAGEAGPDTAALFDVRLETGTDSNALVGKLRGTEWLLSIKPKRDADPTEPFVVPQHELRPGHPAHEAAVPDDEAYQQAYADRRRDIQTQSGLYQHGTAEQSVPAHHIKRGLESTLATAALPPTVAIEGCRPICADCETIYPESHDGVAKAYGCCRDQTATETGVDLPIVDVMLDTSVEHIQNSGFSIYQWQFLRLIERLYENTIEPDAFDLCTESMIALRDEVGLEKDDIEPLVEAELVHRHSEPRKKYYSLTYRGASKLAAIRGNTDISFPEDGAEIKDSIIHVRGCRIARRYLDSCCTDPASPITTIETEYDNLDLVGLTDDGDIHTAIEVERNNNLQQGAIDDYDKLAAAAPETALWVVPNGDVAHELVAALADPNDGSPRVVPDQLYSKQTSPAKYDLNADGCTDVKTFNQLLKHIP